MPQPTRLVLASTSPYRRRLLERLRVPFEVETPDWREVRLGDPDSTVLANAAGKARAVARLRPDDLILASDQVGCCDGRILEKPGTVESARGQLALLSGREHTLHTCVFLRVPGGAESNETVVAHLLVRSLGPDEIAAYLEIDRPLDCSGSYKSEAYGIFLFEHLRCDDPTAIEGLPLIATRRLLQWAGWRIPPVEAR